jgi:hypothetical protein
MAAAHPARPIQALTPWRHGVALWVLIFTCEAVSGALREALLTPTLGAVAAKQVGLVMGSFIILAIATLYAGWMHAGTRRAQLQVGALWVALTIAAEALLAWAMGLPQGALLADYDLARGGFMVFGLLVLLLAPMAGVWLHRRGRHAA